MDEVTALKILNLEPGVSKEKISERYRYLCRIYHPDRLQQDSERIRKEAEKDLKKFSEAYNVLKYYNPPKYINEKVTINSEVKDTFTKEHKTPEKNFQDDYQSQNYQDQTYTAESSPGFAIILAVIAIIAVILVFIMIKSCANSIYQENFNKSQVIEEQDLPGQCLFIDHYLQSILIVKLL